MSSLFFQFGAQAGKAVRQGNWLWQSLTGTDAERITAEEAYGRDLAAAVRAELQIPDLAPDLGRSAWLNALASSLAGCLKEQRWRFDVTLVEQGEPNAFALPGGFLFVQRSLLELCQWDRDEVGFVLGHEMAHVVHSHAWQRLVGGQGLMQVFRALRLGGPLAGVVHQFGLSLLTAAYSRDQEFDADQFGTRLATAAGFAPGGGIRLLEHLQSDGKHGEQEAGLAPYFASHPPFPERIAALRRVISR